VHFKKRKSTSDAEIGNTGHHNFMCFTVSLFARF